MRSRSVFSDEGTPEGRLMSQPVPLVTKTCALVLLRRYTLGIASVPPEPTLVHQDSETV
jgi:hypothetical protein